MAEKKIIVPVYSQAGEKVSELSLDASVFGVEENKQVVYDAIKVYQANMRQDTAKTKKRDEVSGGGKKPWRQKGTGRARAGSSRSPIWVGGGTVFGPTGVQNHKLSQNRKEHRLALRCAYSSKVKELVVVDAWKVSKISTKAIVKDLEALKATGKVLLVLSEDNEKLIKSCSNIASLVITSADNVSVYDLVYFDHIVTDVKTIKLVEENLKEGK
jgi:large subunit ribosomal protein L4